MEELEKYNFGDEFSEGEIQPFSDEFSSDDVVNRDPDITDPFAADFNESKLDAPPKHKGLLTEADIDAIINFKEDDRKNMHFNSKIATGAFSEEVHPDEPHKHFKDYLALPKISGRNSGVPHSSRLPEDYVKMRGEKVEISDDPVIIKDTKQHKQATVIINRDELGEVESIEVVCRCGERTFIKFEFDEETENYDLTEIYNDTVEEPLELDYSEMTKRVDIPSPRPEEIFKREDFTDENSKKKNSGLSTDDIDKMITFGLG